MARRYSGISVGSQDLAELSPKEIPVLPYKGGLVKDVPAFELSDNESPFMNNFRVESGRILKRPGITQVGTDDVGVPVMGLANAFWRDSTYRTFALVADKLYYLNTSANTWDEISAAAGAGLTGSTSQPFSMVVWPESDRFLFSQGKDVVQYFAKGGSAYDRLDATNCPAAELLVVFNRRLNLFVTNESSDIKAQRHRYCVSGNITDWTGVGSGYRDLSDNEEVIYNAKRILGALFVYKEKSISRITATGSSLTPFQYDQAWATGRGLLARKSLASRGDGHYGIFTDGVFFYNGSQFEPVARGKVELALMRSVNSAKLPMVASYYNPDFGEYQLAIPAGSYSYPNEVWAYNEREKQWSYLTYSSRYPVSFGEYIASTSPTIDELSGTIDSLTWPIDFPYYLSPAGGMLIGFSSGVIGKIGALAANDVSTPIQLEWQSRDFVIDKPNRLAAMSGLGIVYEDWGLASITVESSTDGGVTWENQKVVNIGTSGADGKTKFARTWFTTTGQKVRFRVTNSAPSVNVRIVGFYPIVADAGDVF